MQSLASFSAGTLEKTEAESAPSPHPFAERPGGGEAGKPCAENVRVVEDDSGDTPTRGAVAARIERTGGTESGDGSASPNPLDSAIAWFNSQSEGVRTGILLFVGFLVFRGLTK